MNSEKELYSLEMDGKSVFKKMHFAAGGQAERIDFRTGKYRLDRPIQEYKIGDQSIPGFDESEADRPTGETILYLKDFSTTIL